MQSDKGSIGSLRDYELDAISGGRVCNQGPPRMEATVKLGTETLVIWATATCSGTYWK